KTSPSSKRRLFRLQAARRSRLSGTAERFCRAEGADHRGGGRRWVVFEVADRGAKFANREHAAPARTTYHLPLQALASPMTKPAKEQRRTSRPFELIPEARMLRRFRRRRGRFRTLPQPSSEHLDEPDAVLRRFVG